MISNGSGNKLKSYCFIMILIEHVGFVCYNSLIGTIENNDDRKAKRTD